MAECLQMFEELKLKFDFFRKKRTGIIEISKILKKNLIKIYLHLL